MSGLGVATKARIGFEAGEIAVSSNEVRKVARRAAVKEVFLNWLPDFGARELRGCRRPLKDYIEPSIHRSLHALFEPDKTD